MTEDLERVIAKAIDGGWNWPDHGVVHLDMDREMVWFMRFNDEEHTNWTVERNIYELIFSHDFPKALWGESRRDEKGWLIKRGWQEELQDMVIAKDPLAYLIDNYNNQ